MARSHWRPRPERGRFFIAPPRTYGRSVLGAPLEVWQPPSKRPRNLLVAGLHGEEPDTCVVTSRALRCFPQTPRDWAVIICANPDGAARGTRGNARGVDLNRNFPAENWRPAPVTSRWRTVEASEVELSPGDAPASEPETSALLRLLEELRPTRIVALHGPLACIDSPSTDPLAQWLSHETGLPLVEDIGYPTPGSLGSWSRDQGLPVITYELPPLGIEDLILHHVPVVRRMLSGEAD